MVQLRNLGLSLDLTKSSPRILPSLLGGNPNTIKPEMSDKTGIE